MNKLTLVMTYLPAPFGVTVGTTDVPWPCAGIHGTTVSVSPSCGAFALSVTVNSIVDVPRGGGCGEVRTVTASSPLSLVVERYGASGNVADEALGAGDDPDAHPTTSESAIATFSVLIAFLPSVVWRFAFEPGQERGPLGR
jgi:hypothetical protein